MAQRQRSPATAVAQPDGVGYLKSQPPQGLTALSPPEREAVKKLTIDYFRP